MPAPLHFLSSFLVFLFLSATANASALTTAISPNERLCFYAEVDKPGKRIGVRRALSLNLGAFIDTLN